MAHFPSWEGSSILGRRAWVQPVWQFTQTGSQVPGISSEWCFWPVNMSGESGLNYCVVLQFHKHKFSVLLQFMKIRSPVLCDRDMCLICIVFWEYISQWVGHGIPVVMLKASCLCPTLFSQFCSSIFVKYNCSAPGCCKQMYVSWMSLIFYSVFWLLILCHSFCS